MLDETIASALARYPALRPTRVLPYGAGLINRTYLVEGAAGAHVLQRVNPIFDPAIHDNILAVTTHLHSAGLVTPRLVPTGDGATHADLGEGGVWRVLTHVRGRCRATPERPAQARSGGALIARFHRALDDLDHTFVGLRLGVHDTAAHLEMLRDTLAAQSHHRLYPRIAPLAEAILQAAARLPCPAALPPRICHGDLKFSNLLFAEDEPDRALCLIDLDTLGPMSLAAEMGDAWRSWCNGNGEDTPHASFDLELFGASWEGYRDGYGAPLDRLTREALLVGVEQISLELCARFAADALAERYFGWDASRYPAAGEHNLVRARGQWALHEAAVRTRPERRAVLGVTSP